MTAIKYICPIRIKFGYKIGDKVIFTDGSEDKMYAFEIADQVKYGNGLYFFMNTDAMRKAFGLPYFMKMILKREQDLRKAVITITIPCFRIKSLHLSTI